MSERKANVAETPTPRRESIFVVDDEAMLLELASVILAPLGYEIRTFRDGESALEAFKAARPRPALLITDYAMHRMNGMALIQACRKVEPDQKILMISGTVGPEIFERAPERPNRFLSKPYKARQLLDSAKALLGK